MQLRFQLQGRSSVTKGKQGRVKETEGVLNGAVYSHCHGFFSVQKILSAYTTITADAIARFQNKMHGITHMDAALDAMRPLGFRTQLILRTELLQVYGGNQGWCFIEEAYYKLLMEALLSKQQGSAEYKVGMELTK
ncbi:hypothetical protein GmHk_18G052827 [Glycine max]|nr:hypothetical protein GmHk_18G052827 [Glycine max]KAH1199469.1 hypothetical protein GmHk_18G052827 [Glycine max]